MPTALIHSGADLSAAAHDDSGGQRLNAADRLMLVAHSGLRRLGHPGFCCQTHLWTAGRIDAEALREALARLNARYPVITARLDEGLDGSGPSWRFRRGATVQLHEFDAADEAAVRAYAETLSSSELDLDRHDLIAFHVVHLPDHRDVFIMRFTHVLMDGKAPELVLREINRCHADMGAADRESSGAAEHPDKQQHSQDEMAAHLARFDRRQRVRTALRVVGSHIRLPEKFVTLDPPDLDEWRFAPFRMSVRTLDEDATSALSARVKRLCGFVNLAPALLAGTFRAIRSVTPQEQNGRSVYQTEVPLNLRPPGRFEPVFRNFMSFIPLRARGVELADRDELTLHLNSQMRHQLRRGIDLGNLQMMAVMAPRARLLARHLLERMKRHPFSLGFGYQGPVVPGLERFCGRPVRQLYAINAAGSPPGMTLQVNQCLGRLNLCAAYVSSGVPDSLAEAFLEELAADLTR